MDESVVAFVKALHDYPMRMVMVTAGAGAQALSWLLGVAGASRTLIEALVPYDAAASNEFLGQNPQPVRLPRGGPTHGRAGLHPRPLVRPTRRAGDGSLLHRHHHHRPPQTGPTSCPHRHLAKRTRPRLQSHFV
jgi:hypothetical protein